MTTQETVLKAVYEARCEQIQLAWLNPETRHLVSTPYAYAASKRLYPFSHQDMDKEDPFLSAYVIGKEFVEEVTAYIDEKWVENKNAPVLKFSELEDKFGRSNRMELAYILRYCYLNKLFSDEFYKGLLDGAPVEAKSIVRKLDETEMAIP